MTKNNDYGILKHNESTNPRAPQLKGSIHINGQAYWVSAWYFPHGTKKVGTKLEHVPHYQLSIEIANQPSTASGHVGGQNFSTAKENQPYSAPYQASAGPKDFDIPF